MNLREIEERVAAVEPRPGVEYLSDLLLAYGLPRTSVSRLMSGTYDKADTADERLWKDKVYFRYTDGPDEDLYGLIDAARADERVVKHRPRFLIVKNDHRLLAGDQRTGATLDIEVRPRRRWPSSTTRSSGTTASRPMPRSTTSTSSSRDCCSASSPRTPGSSRQAPSPTRWAPIRASLERTPHSFLDQLSSTSTTSAATASADNRWPRWNATSQW